MAQFNRSLTSLWPYHIIEFCAFIRCYILKVLQIETCQAKYKTSLRKLRWQDYDAIIMQKKSVH